MEPLRHDPRPAPKRVLGHGSLVKGLPKKATYRTTSGHPIGLADQRKPGR